MSRHAVIEKALSLDFTDYAEKRRPGSVIPPERSEVRICLNLAM